MNNIQELAKKIHEEQVADWKRKHMKEKLEENPDWAIKRIEAILRECERLGVEEIKWLFDHNKVGTTWKGLPLLGRFSYESRGGHFHESRWMRPRIALRFWVKTTVRGGWNNASYETGYLSYEGKDISRYRGADTMKGGETLEIVFGKERMMVYNRLLSATLNCMGKVK